MEWVETTGRTVAEAKDAALDELGVDEADAEFEVLSEPQHGLFGRLRAEARVRARVRPTAPRAKEDRRSRDRKRRSESRSSDTAGNGRIGAAAGDAASTVAPSVSSPPSGEKTARPASLRPAEPAADEAPDPTAGRERHLTAAAADAADASDAHGEGDGNRASGPSPSRRRRGRGGHRPGEAPTGVQRAQAEQVDGSGARYTHGDAEGDDDDYRGKGTDVEVDMDQQAEVAVGFLTELVAEFGAEATAKVVRPDDDTAEIQLSGGDLGILIGPKGQTLTAIQNLTRTVVFNETGANNGHINVDVSGYRQKRTEALIRFAQQAAAHVKASGQRTALEPMSSIDRKIVHDTIAAIDGVSTVSEGEEPRRRVVVLPD